MSFREDFLWGGAVAAHQLEGGWDQGGKGPSVADVMTVGANGVPRRITDGVIEGEKYPNHEAIDFYHRYKEDIALFAKMGFKVYRFSIAWTRIFPNGVGQINQEGVDFYHRVFQECKKQGVEPYVTLHHFDTPDALHKIGDFLNHEIIDQYTNYAKFCFQEYHDEVKYWFTFNEVWPIAVNQYIVGSFPPAIKYDIPKAVYSMHHMIVAPAEAVLAVKEGK